MREVFDNICVNTGVFSFFFWIWSGFGASKKWQTTEAFECACASPHIAQDCDTIIPYPKGPKIEKIQSRLKFSIELEIFNPDLTLILQSLLLWQKSEDAPKKARIFLPAEPLKSLEKREKTHKKARKTAKRKKRVKRKKRGKKEGQGKNSLQQIGVWWAARLKFSVSLENFKICDRPRPTQGLPGPSGDPVWGGADRIPERRNCRSFKGQHD